MRILVTWGSKRGGTAGLGRAVAEVLETRGYEVVSGPAVRVRQLQSFDAAVVGGALYAGRWPGEVRRFVGRNVRALRKIPTWFFSSGPLDDTADRDEIPPPRQVAVLAERVGAKAHTTFGGRLEPDAKGFPASAMAKKQSGDWRNFDRVREWAGEIANELPTAQPGRYVDHPGHSLVRLLAHGLLGWLLCGATMGGLLALTNTTFAVVGHAAAAPLFFTAIAWHYFSARGARDPLPTAFIWTSLVVVLDLVVVAGLVMQSLEMFRSIAGTWIPFGLIFLSSWITGAVISFMPERTQTPKAETAIQSP